MTGPRWDADKPDLSGGSTADASACPPESAAAGPPARERVRSRGGRRHRSRKEAVLGPWALLRETVVVVLIALVLSLLVKTFLLQAFYIPSESMETTLVKGDRVIVSKLTPGPFDLQRGDVIVFTDPGDWLPEHTARPKGPVVRALTFVGLLPNDSNDHLIKRVIGLPGDRVVCCDKAGAITVNGTPLDEPYIYPGQPTTQKAFDEKVPADSLWVMGDHRSRSDDSRYQGFVPVKDVTGRAVALLWPFDRAKWLTRHSATFDTVGGAAP